MPIQTFTLANELNVSLQVGDTIYYCQTVGQQAGRNHPSATTDTKPRKLGVVTSVTRSSRKLDVFIRSAPVNLDGMYIFFSKDRRVNYSGVVGYFMEVEYRNESGLKSEIFATATDYVESSR